MAYLPAEKRFTAGGTPTEGRAVPLKPFLFARGDASASLRPAAGLREYAGAKPVGGLDRTAATRSDVLSTERTPAGTDRTVATREVASRAAPDGSRALFGSDRAYVPAGKKFAARGKRQDALDRQTSEGKPLTVDDVRALLNKGPRPPEAVDVPRP